MADLKSRIYPHILNARGWRTKRKIVVLESDDWGSIRTSSKEAYNMLLNAGTRVDKCPYCKNDSLASQDDLQLLFEVLAKHKDSKGKPALITANTIVANPDFDKIKEQRFETYFYEPFTETLKKYPNHEKSFQLWKEGISSNLFFPQFHGREHLNVHRWLQALRSGSKETLLAFENKMFGISTTITVEKRRSYMAALEYDDQKQMEWQKEMLVDGLDLFEKIFIIYCFFY